MAKKGESSENLFCSFCGKNQKEVKKLIAGPAVYICDECINCAARSLKKRSKKRGRRFKTS